MESNTEEVVEKTDAELVTDDNRRALINDVVKEASMIFRQEDYRSDTVHREEMIMPEKVTRFIDIDEKNKKTGTYDPKQDDWGNAIELQGQLGNIPLHQTPYIQISNFNNVWTKLRDGIYLDVYDKDEYGQLKVDDEGYPILLYSRVVDVGRETRNIQLRTNLAVAENRVKRQAQVMVGIMGGNPMSLDGNWDQTMELMFGKQKQKR